VNIMTENIWEILGNPTVVPSLERIGLFKRKMITLCGKFTNVPVIIHGHRQKRNLKLLGLLTTMPRSHFC
jgi:hypothetical protein